MFIVFQDKILKLDLKVFTFNNNAANLQILTYLQAVFFLGPAWSKHCDLLLIFRPNYKTFSLFLEHSAI